MGYKRIIGVRAFFLAPGSREMASFKPELYYSRRSRLDKSCSSGGYDSPRRTFQYNRWQLRRILTYTSVRQGLTKSVTIFPISGPASHWLLMSSAPTGTVALKTKTTQSSRRSLAAGEPNSRNTTCGQVKANRNGNIATDPTHIPTFNRVDTIWRIDSDPSSTALIPRTAQNPFNVAPCHSDGNAFRGRQAHARSDIKNIGIMFFARNQHS